MIVDMVRGDIFNTPHKHIAFAVNTEGCNDSGFAGQVASRYWPELADLGEKQLGEVLTCPYRAADGKIFHALVCHSLEDGWGDAPWAIEQCLNTLNVPGGETIAVVLMGAGMVGQMSGADVFANLGGMARSRKKVAVYTL